MYFITSYLIMAGNDVKIYIVENDKTLKLRAKISRSACKTNWNDVKEFPFWKIYIPQFYTCIPISESHNQCFTKSCMHIQEFSNDCSIHWGFLDKTTCLCTRRIQNNLFAFCLLIRQLVVLVFWYHMQN